MAIQRRHITFFGRVQGVGFRYSAVQAAGGYGLTGYVRNLPDGSVECVAEGESSDIDGFLEDLRDRMGRHIERTTQTIDSPTGQYRSFGVEF